MLADYWAHNGKEIKERGFLSSDKRVITLNYVATYAGDLPRVFDVLDEIQAKHETDHPKIILISNERQPNE